jgi:hypothetical protein
MLLVAGVEAVHAAEHDPQRQREREQRGLEQGPHLIDGRVVAGERQLREREGCQDAEHVRSRERPPHHPAARVPLAGAPLREQRPRALVEHALERAHCRRASLEALGCVNRNRLLNPPVQTRSASFT